MKQFRFLLFALVVLCLPLLLGATSHEQGIASWYDSDPEGPLTANGERFDPEAMAAAHKSLTFGTQVRVHDLETGLSVDVRINDRGPYVDGRIIDLTPAAARVIDMYERGISPVELEILYIPRVPESRYNRPGDTGWYQIQLGAFAHTQAVYEMYMKLYELGFRVQVEIVQERLLRLSVRWIPEEDRDTSLLILESLGFRSPLIRGDIEPQ